MTSKTENGKISTYAYDNMGNLIRETNENGTKTYEYNGNNKLALGTNEIGETSEYLYNALGVRITNIQTTENQNANYATSNFDVGSTFLGDYLNFLTPDNNKNTYYSDVDTVHQKETETLTKEYVIDYLSVANRDVYVEDEMISTRYVYGNQGERISAEFDYADDTNESETHHNIASEIAERHDKIFFRFSLLDSTLFAVDKNGDMIAM